LPEFWQYVPHLDKAFFANSGSEAVEAAIKIVRAATTRSGIVYCSHAFTALPMGRCLSMVTRFSVPALEVMEAEGLTQNAARLGARLLATFQGMVKRHELVKSARGKGLMIGVEFGAPRSLKLKASWNLLETANSGLFCQLIVIPLLKEQRILSQVAATAITRSSFCRR
jgi:4-aminobutyrate aminotransferase-like enzyme